MTFNQLPWLLLSVGCWSPKPITKNLRTTPVHAMNQVVQYLEGHGRAVLRVASLPQLPASSNLAKLSLPTTDVGSQPPMLQINYVLARFPPTDARATLGFST
jgi:hypothetical protein